MGALKVGAGRGGGGAVVALALGHYMYIDLRLGRQAVHVHCTRLLTFQCMYIVHDF